MASKKQKKQEQTEEQVNNTRTPWIQYKTGVIIIAITSILMAVLSATQFIQMGVGTLEGILRGLAYGVLIWVIFFGYIYFNRFIRRL